MNKFLITLFRFSIIGLIPVLIAILAYLYLDPFKVIRTYDSFYQNDLKGAVGLNKDYVSTTTFITNLEKRKANYNSFILGNSRSIFYQISDWKKHLSLESNCYHFDASGESLWALNKKIEFIDKQGIKIKNLLLILDYTTLIQDKPKSGHLFIISPALVGNKNWVDFHLAFFKAFLSPRFFFAYTDFKISRKAKPYMSENFLINLDPKKYDSKTNEEQYVVFEGLIEKNEYYNSKRCAVFYKRDAVQKQSAVAILESQKQILSSLQKILKEHKTNTKIVISPLYNQEKLNDKDLSYLKNLFGSDHVFDFSGINKYTNNYKNYYENSHYRPCVARQIMEEIYKKQ